MNTNTYYNEHVEVINGNQGNCYYGCRRQITFVSSEGCEPHELTGMCGLCRRNPNDCTRRRITKEERALITTI